MRGLLLLLFLYPTLGFAWAVSERCELIHESSEGRLMVTPTGSGILLYLPEGFVADDSRVKVGIGHRSWTLGVVGGAVELTGGDRPFLEKNWLTVHADGDQVLGVSLRGSTAAWEKLKGCEPPERGGWLTLSGEITASTDDRVIAAIRRERPAGLALDSAGGLANEARRIGYAVRAAGIATRVGDGGQCLSECTFILAAGVRRKVDRGGRVGVPPTFFTRGLGVVGESRGPVADNTTYFHEMGVDGGRLAVLATSDNRPGLRTYTTAELLDVGLANAEPERLAVQTDAAGAADPQDGGWLWLVGLVAGLATIVWGLALLWIKPERSG
jgi:hypothetical protein